MRDEGQGAGVLTELSWLDLGLDVLLVLQGQARTAMKHELSAKTGKGL